MMSFLFIKNYYAYYKMSKDFVIREFKADVPLPPCGIYFARIDCHTL